MIRKFTLLSLILLSGCSINKADKSLPFSLTEEGFNVIKKETIIDQDVIQQALGSNYTVRSGLYLKNDQLKKVYDAVKDNVLAFIFYVSKDEKIESIDIFDKNIKTKHKMNIGSKFSKLYSKAFGFCEKGSIVDDRVEVVCQAPKSNTIFYTFQGEWNGPKELIPSDDQLKDWTVKKVTWSLIQ